MDRRPRRRGEPQEAHGQVRDDLVQIGWPWLEKHGGRIQGQDGEYASVMDQDFGIGLLILEQ